MNFPLGGIMRSLFTLWVLFSLSAHGYFTPPDLMRGKILDREKKDQLLFDYKRNVEKSPEGQVVTRTFTYPDGKVAATETITYTGNKVTRMEQVQTQTNATGFFELKG